MTKTRLRLRQGEGRGFRLSKVVESEKEAQQIITPLHAGPNVEEAKLIINTCNSHKITSHLMKYNYIF